jgi:hypothetical protein
VTLPDHGHNCFLISSDAPVASLLMQQVHQTSRQIFCHSAKGMRVIFIPRRTCALGIRNRPQTKKAIKTPQNI